MGITSVRIGVDGGQGRRGVLFVVTRGMFEPNSSMCVIRSLGTEEGARLWSYN